MKISTRLKLAGLVSAAVVTVIGFVLLTATQQLRRELADEEAAVEILRAVSDVRYLTLEYVLRHEERSEAQWRLRHTSLSMLLSGMSLFTSPEEQAIKDGLARTHENIEILFDQLVVNQRDHRRGAENGAVLEELAARLTGQILNKVQAMISDVVTLSEQSRVGVRDAQQRTVFAVVMFGGIAVVFVATMLYLILGSVTRPLAKLHEGTAVIGAGNLDFRLDVVTQDEIGDLARAFDGMTAKLKGTTVSRDELVKVNEALRFELVRRQRAEADLGRHEEELTRANHALEMSNLDLKRFAYVASHDLQTPLRSISGFVQLIRSEYAGRLDAQADDWIQRTVHATQILQTSIQDLLAYSRVDAEPHPFVQVSFRAIFDDAVLLLRAPIEDSAARVTCGELPTLMGDRSQLTQLMQNLIGNALKYRGDAPDVHVSAQRNDTEWVFSVRDNGIGIDPRYHERIFEIFQRLHNQQQYPGSGIGLAVCRRVVHRHGGRIWVESEPGSGSIFYFTIPERKVGDP